MASSPCPDLVNPLYVVGSDDLRSVFAMYCVNCVFGISSGSQTRLLLFQTTLFIQTQQRTACFLYRRLIGGVVFDALQIGADVGIVRQSEAVGGGLQRVTHHDVGAAEPVVDQPVFAV